jgi:hypothetical protein
VVFVRLFGFEPGSRTQEATPAVDRAEAWVAEDGRPQTASALYQRWSEGDLRVLDDLMEGVQILGPGMEYRYINHAAAAQVIRRPARRGEQPVPGTVVPLTGEAPGHQGRRHPTGAIHQKPRPPELAGLLEGTPAEHRQGVLDDEQETDYRGAMAHGHLGKA